METRLSTIMVLIEVTCNRIKSKPIPKKCIFMND
jgi:hypothetical protein